MSFKIPPNPNHWAIHDPKAELYHLLLPTLPCRARAHPQELRMPSSPPSVPGPVSPSQPEPKYSPWFSFLVDTTGALSQSPFP